MKLRETYVERRPMWGTFGIHLIGEQPDETGKPERHYALPLSWAAIDPSTLGTTIAITPEPALDLPPDAAQQLMDELWKAGLRPTEGHGSTGQIGATERHLEDMRRIVFDHLSQQR